MPLPNSIEVLMSEENAWCIQEWAIDTKQTAYAQISEKLLNLKGVTPTQHLFIIKVAMLQMRRKAPLYVRKILFPIITVNHQALH